MSNPISRNWWFPLLFAIVLAAGMYFGYSLQNTRAGFIFQGGQLFLKHHNDNILQETLDLIENKYVEEVEMTDKYAAAIEALLAELDPHSYYIPKRDLKGVQEEMSGNFEGIGIEFSIVKDTVQVIAPIQGGPSFQLGIISGDKIIKVDDSLVAGVNIRNDEIIRRLKGPKGTKVKVSIKRYGKTDLIDFNITRDKIPMYSVEGGFMLNDSVGYIKVNRFSETTEEEFKAKLSALMDVGVGHLVLDLRQNPGGYLQQAVKLVNLFLEKGKDVVHTDGRVVPRYTYKTELSDNYFKGKVAVLIDEGSASASEIVAGALQDWDRAVIIGRRSFGKGLVQDQYDLMDGSAVRLTVAKYFTPSGRSIQKPYVNGDKGYDNDVSKRFEDGELLEQDNRSALAKQDTSIKYFTKNLKRPVFGGGGIMPDIFIPVDTSFMNSFFMQVITEGVLQEFTYDYYSKNKSAYSGYKTAEAFKKNYEVTETMYRAFVKYAGQVGVKHLSGAEVPAVKKNLQLRLKAYMARQALGASASLEVLSAHDGMIEKALEVLQKPSVLDGL